MPDDFVPQLSVEVGGVELTDEVYDRLTDVRAESTVQLPDQVKLTFVDPDFALFDEQRFSVGDAVEVSIASDGQPQTVADCDVTGITLQPGRDGGMTMVVTAHGADHALYRGVGLATFVDQTDSEIVSTVGSDAGLQVSVESSSLRHPYIMQAAPGNLFLDECAQRVGYRWWVEGRTLNFKKRLPEVTGPTLTWGESLLSLRVHSATADATPAVDVRSWNPDTQSDITASFTPAATLDTIGTDAPGPTAVAGDGSSLSTLNRFQASRPTGDDSAATAMAEGLADRASSQALTLRGWALGDPALQAGSTVDIAGVGERLSGRYRIAKVEHVYSAGDGYTTWFETGGQEANGLVDLLRSRPAPAAWNPNALVIGVVTNLVDPERPARVKVRFPTFSDTFESAWARLVLPGAGADRGLHVMPEVDDEVLVGFEHGDPSRPVVLGGLWSKQNAPPTDTATTVVNNLVEVRTWKSRAGHSITIRDAADSDPQSIIVELADGATRLTLAEDRVILETPSDLTITTEGNGEIAAQGDLSITGANVSISADSELSLEGAQMVAKGTSSVKVDGGMVDVVASSKMALDGGGMTQIKGGMVQLN